MANRKREIEKPIVNKGSEVAVLGQVNLDLTISTRQLASVSGINRTSIHTILKKNKFHPYKIHLVQERHENDCDRRLQFCKIMRERAGNEPQFIFNIRLSDEYSFFLNGTVSQSSQLPLLDRFKPKSFSYEVHTQQPEKLNVWARIFSDRLVDPVFLPGNLTGQMYLQLLENAIDPALTDIIENIPEYDEDHLIFQQDGAPPHYALIVRQYLDQRFPRN